MDDETQTLKLDEATLVAAGGDGSIQVRFEDGDRPTWEIPRRDVERLYEFLKQHVAVPSGIG